MLVNSRHLPVRSDLPSQVTDGQNSWDPNGSLTGCQAAGGFVYGAADLNSARWSVRATNLSARIARSLEYALNTRLQTVRLNLELLPSFEPCDAAKPRTARLAANFAKALRADAFVGGGSPVFVDSGRECGHGNIDTK
jgi:hypothetical protein